MAKKNPNDRKGPGKPDPNDPKSKAELPEWLRTDDWLQITPPPIKRELPDSPSGKGMSGDEQATDMIELEEDGSENVDVPPSTMLFSDPDDSVILNDDLPLSGPLSGKLQAGSSSIKLPIAQPPSSGPIDADDGIELGVMPPVENPRLAGPSTSGIRRLPPVAPVASEDAIGQPMKPTQPASGWMLSSTQLPEVPAEGSKARYPSVPSVGNIQATWAELDLPASKLPPARTKPAEQHPDSWHPSSGNIGVPSMANIDLPPDEGDSGSDIFSKASRPGAAPSALKIEIPKPKPIARSEAPKVPAEPAAPSGPIPATPSLSLPSAPDVPAVQPKGSWHPSSGNLHLPSVGEIDLPPSADVSDIFSGANRPGRPIEAKLERPKTPARPTAPAKPAIPVPSLSATNFELVPEDAKPSGPGSGWMLDKAAPSAPAVPVGLEPTSDFQSSADIDLPPEKGEGASDIFSTATKPKVSTAGGSGIFSGAALPGAEPSNPPPGDSNLLVDPPAPKDAGRVDFATPGLEVTGELHLSQLLPGSRSGAINFAMPEPTSDGSRTSSIEVLDTSGSLDGGKTNRVPDASQPFEALRSDNLFEEGDLAGDAGNLEAELARQLADDEGKPDFNFLPGVSQSDSNILGDRTMSEQSRSAPQSSSVNLADPNAASAEPGVDSGQPSSIFNKVDLSTQASGHVDLDEIPLMGSSDSGTMPVDTGHSAVLGGRLDEPHGMDLEESVFDVTMPKDEAADSGMIDWSADAAKVTDRLGMQASMEDSRRSELSAGSDQPSLPTVPRKAAVNRPTSRPDIDLDDAPAPARAPSKSRNAVLVTALSLFAGAGIGAGGMFLAGGPGATKADPVAVASLNEAKTKLTAAEQIAADAKKQVESLNAANAQMKDAADAGAKAVADLKVLADDKKKLETDALDAKAKADSAEALAKKLGDEKTALLADVKKAADDAAKLMNAATVAKLDAETKGKMFDAAKVVADAATAKLKVADGLLDPVLEKLKAAKLIDDKADREKALAALPDALKKANLITGEGEVAKLAKELSDTRDILKKQKDDADKKLSTATDLLATAKKDADKQLADAKAASEKAMADLQAKVDTADKRIADEVKKAVATATKDADAKITKSQEALVAQQQAAKLELQKEATARAGEAKQFEAKLTERTEQFEKQLASARAGAVVPLSDASVAKLEQSANAYDSGNAAYFAGRYDEAEKSFAEAAKANPSDARSWYFLGLSKYAQGRAADAAADFKTGAEWEGRAKPGRRAVAAALESVQGPARLALEAVRP